MSLGSAHSFLNTPIQQGNSFDNPGHVPGGQACGRLVAMPALPGVQCTRRGALDLVQDRFELFCQGLLAGLPPGHGRCAAVRNTRAQISPPTRSRGKHRLRQSQQHLPTGDPRLSSGGCVLYFIGPGPLDHGTQQTVKSARRNHTPGVKRTGIRVST